MFLLGVTLKEGVSDCLEVRLQSLACAYTQIPSQGRSCPISPQLLSCQECVLFSEQKIKKIFALDMQQGNLPPIKCCLLEGFFPHIPSHRNQLLFLAGMQRTFIRNNTSRKQQMLAVTFYRAPACKTALKLLTWLMSLGTLGVLLLSTQQQFHFKFSPVSNFCGVLWWPQELPTWSLGCDEHFQLETTHAQPI